jgi:hypothetical protein
VKETSSEPGAGDAPGPRAPATALSCFVVLSKSLPSLMRTVLMPRKVMRAPLAAGPMREPRDAFYELYVRADYP